ncbi:MAG: FAD-dependent oxidoreductase [Actinomycetota bacterium]
MHNKDATLLSALSTEKFDVLVIGGGVTGVGAALDAVSRGLRVCPCESQDLASGTSSRSSKLIHGGLRYLEQYDFRLVREALQEREAMVTSWHHIWLSLLLFSIPSTKNERSNICWCWSCAL